MHSSEDADESASVEEARGQARKERPLDEPGQQWSWKLTLSILSAIGGAIIALYLFRVL